jgi:hypothetical protein
MVCLSYIGLEPALCQINGFRYVDPIVYLLCLRYEQFDLFFDLIQLRVGLFIHRLHGKSFGSALIQRLDYRSADRMRVWQQTRCFSDLIFVYRIEKIFIVRHLFI